MGPSELTDPEESTPEDRLVRWLSSFQDEILDWPPPSKEEPPLGSQEELKERRGRRSGRLIRERRIAALIQRWRPI